MTPDPASLDRLHDIVVPPPVPWWPPAPGWLWLLSVVALMGLVLLLHAARHWQRNRYRREALAELAQIVAANHSDTAARMAALLKRTALTAYSRPAVAALTGSDWFAFLDRSGGTHFSAGLGAALECANYGIGGATLDAPGTRALANEIRAWIRHHTLALSTDEAAGTPAPTAGSAHTAAPAAGNRAP